MASLPSSLVPVEGSRRSIALIIKPTDDCNLACAYCYARSRQSQRRMSARTLRRMIEGVRSIPELKNITFIWHGGEPLLVGKQFFVEARALQRSLLGGLHVRNRIQTNATLVNDADLDFFESERFRFGTSIDGPAEVHDLNRKYASGRGSFEAVCAGVQRLRTRDRLRPPMKDEDGRPYTLGGGAVMVLNRANIKSLAVSYEFFRSQDIPVKINPYVPVAYGLGGDDSRHAISPEQYGAAMVSLFDVWFNEPCVGIEVDPFSAVLQNLLTDVPICCSWGASCRQKFLAVDSAGDVYPCGRFVGRNDYLLGNVNETGLNECISSPCHRTLSTRNAAMMDACRKCRFVKICNGGCMHNAAVMRGSVFEPDGYCLGYRMLFEHVERALEDELGRTGMTREGLSGVLRQYRCTDREHATAAVPAVLNPKLRRLVSRLTENHRAQSDYNETYNERHRDYSDYKDYKDYKDYSDYDDHDRCGQHG